MRDILRFFFIGMVVVVLQWLFFGRISLWGSTPDIVLLFVLWMSVRYGQIGGALTGFIAGFGLDAIYGLWGTHMFVKTLIGFSIGTVNVINTEVLERSARRIVEITLVVSLIHNGLMSIFIILQEGISRDHLIWVLCVGNTLYTTFAAYVMAIFKRR
ncbi:MAG: rod shape-determining protein MreD [Bacteroidetes bacterium]|nr:rod shape-determining protein MreD [Bacteroidota bacterium]MCY4223579.1 rod shape-determining protein MreD [Bacteroidota bacterium]